MLTIVGTKGIFAKPFLRPPHILRHVPIKQNDKQQKPINSIRLYIGLILYGKLSSSISRIAIKFKIRS